MNKVLRIARTLSLDIVLGAMVSSMFVAEYMHLQLPWIYTIALALSVWIIYTADHLADASDIPHRAHTFRHQFHQRYFKRLCVFVGIAMLGGIIILFQLPLSLIYWGTLVLVLVGIYFISIRWLKIESVFHKEFVIAILYSIGIFLAPVYLSSFPPQITVWILFIQFILLALTNLLLFSWYEKELDILDLHTSFATVMGEKTATRIIKLCLTILYVMTVASIIYFYSDLSFVYAELVILLMIISLHGVLLFPAHFKQSEMYRSIADSIFLYPIIYLLL